MSEDTPKESSAPPAPKPSPEQKPPWFTWLEARQRFKELLVVFFGVYAAFMLNRFEADRRDTARRNLLLGSLEREVSTDVEDLKGALAEAQKIADNFDRRLAASEMPPLSIAYTSTGYSANDDATLLQAGGLELLDADTLDQLRKVNGLQRALVEALQADFQLKLTLLGPREGSDFYDPATKQLRRHYAWYPTVQRAILKNARELLASEEEFLARIRARVKRR